MHHELCKTAIPSLKVSKSRIKDCQLHRFFFSHTTWTEIDVFPFFPDGKSYYYKIPTNFTETEILLRKPLFYSQLPKNFHLNLQADQTHTCWAGEKTDWEKYVCAIILSEFLKQSLICYLRSKDLLFIWKVSGKYKFQGIKKINSRIRSKLKRPKKIKALKSQYFR